LGAAVGWSLDLLTAEEHAFVSAMSVFRGGWTTPAASAVYTPAVTGSQEPDLVELTARLVDKSLVLVRRDGPVARYDMLEIIRRHAHERLESSGQRSAVELRHLDYFIASAEEAAAQVRGPSAEWCLAWFDAEAENLRVAIHRAKRSRRSTDATRLRDALSVYGELRGHSPDWFWNEQD
jgi:predicted ATPase